MDVETKLKRFSEVVLKEAEEIKKNSLKALDEKHSKNIKEFEQKAEAKYKDMLDDATITAEKEKQKLIAQKSAEVKKALIQKRTDYINSLFENVLRNLDSFFKSPEYEQLIVDYIEGYKVNSNSAITAYIMQRDIALKDSIVNKTGVSVMTTDEDFLGGVKILLDKNRIADCTLKHRYEHEKACFNKIKIL